MTAAGEASRSALGKQLELSREEFASIGIQLGARYDDSPIIVADGTKPPADDPACLSAKRLSRRPGAASVPARPKLAVRSFRNRLLSASSPRRSRHPERWKMPRGARRMPLTDVESRSAGRPRALRMRPRADPPGSACRLARQRASRRLRRAAGARHRLVGRACCRGRPARLTAPLNLPQCALPILRQVASHPRRMQAGSLPMALRATGRLRSYCDAAGLSPFRADRSRPRRHIAGDPGRRRADPRDGPQGRGRL